MGDTTRGAPILQIRGAPSRGVRGLSQGYFRLWEDQVEHFEPHKLLGTISQTVRMDQIAQVVVRRGPVASTLVIESVGGHTLTLFGAAWTEAEHFKSTLDRLIDKVKAPSRPSATPDLADQLRKLAALVDEGILTQAEFEAQKARLLG